MQIIQHIESPSAHHHSLHELGEDNFPTCKKRSAGVLKNISSSAFFAGAVLAIIDLLLFWHQAPFVKASFILTILAVVLFAATAVALVGQLAFWGTSFCGRRRWRRSLVGGLIALPAIIPVAFLLFQGTGISTKWYAPYGPYVVAPLMFGGVVIGLWASGRMAYWVMEAPKVLRRGVAGVLLGVAGALLVCDARVYPHQYGYLHWVLLLMTTLALMAFDAILHAPRRLRTRPWIAMLLLGLSVPATAISAFTSLETNRDRQLLEQYTHTAWRIVAVLRRLADWDGDHYSILFGEHDCDNLNSKIHPFALEVEGNDVDEDCDGKDSLPPSAKASSSSGIASSEQYRQFWRGWRGEPTIQKVFKATAAYNVVLIVIDALRAQEVTFSEANMRHHPNLMQLLQESRFFTRTFATGAGTDISMATIFTGYLDPFSHAKRSILRKLKAAGIKTYAVYPREVDRWLSRQFPLEGLSERKIVVNDPRQKDVGSEATSKQVTDQAIQFLQRSNGEQFFLWLHFFDVHEHHQIDSRTLGTDWTPQYPGPYGRYRMMLRFVDMHLGRFIKALKASQLSERTIVVLFGDHGEGLAQSPRLPEHHGDVLYNPLVHVPLAIRLPLVKARAIDVPTSLVDVCPTLLDLLGLPLAGEDGVSLTPYLIDLDEDHFKRLLNFKRDLFLLETKQQGIIRWPYKLLLWLDQGLVELYDLDHDFSENNNLADEKKELAAALARRLRAKKLITIDRLNYSKQSK